MQNRHGCSDLPGPLNRPAGLVWHHVQYEYRDDTSTLAIFNSLDASPSNVPVLLEEAVSENGEKNRLM